MSQEFTVHYTSGPTRHIKSDSGGTVITDEYFRGIASVVDVVTIKNGKETVKRVYKEHQGTKAPIAPLTQD